ncbi:flagellar biosynthetic protein FliR [Siccirubricoccus sp. G192]|uniref:flagellar biosynthetic protein FliR n=1 Tax=Siccirubricoccus sp. G192 TaxID=2849651 RepID=UPI0028116CE8|nr:flagellar biosynthetic protein FliR [Siccirubricoccus sp. G192]
MSPVELPLLAFHAALVFARVGGAMLLLPGLGEADVPATIRLSLVLALVALLLPGLSPALPPVPGTVPELLRLVLIETGIGLWLGLLARLLALAMAQAGQMAALMIGLASPLQTDPLLGAQSTATGRLFGLLAAALVLGSGLYALPLRALAGSYALLPPGGDLPLGAGAESVALGVAESFGLALRLAAPLVLAAVLGQLALGLLARLAPQVQIFAVAAPGQLLAGLLLLVLVLPALLSTWATATREGFLALPGLH